MTARFHLCTEIEASVSEVWGVLEPVERHVDWMADAVEITFRSERRRGVGTDFDCLTQVGPIRLTDRMTCVEWDEGRAMGIVHRGLVTGRGRFTLVPIGAKRTQFCWDEELRFPWWMGGPIGELVARPVLLALWRGNLDRLAAQFEATR